MTETDIRLTGWGTFDDLAVSIRALLFGEMVKRGIEVIGEYHSDLYHDALWVHGNVHGEMSFMWIVRPSGTHIGNTAQIVFGEDSLWQKGSVAYVIHLFPRGGEWFAWFEVAKDDHPPAMEQEAFDALYVPLGGASRSTGEATRTVAEVTRTIFGLMADTDAENPEYNRACREVASDLGIIVPERP